MEGREMHRLLKQNFPFFRAISCEFFSSLSLSIYVPLYDLCALSLRFFLWFAVDFLRCLFGFPLPTVRISSMKRQSNKERGKKCNWEMSRFQAGDRKPTRSSLRFETFSFCQVSFETKAVVSTFSLLLHRVCCSVAIGSVFLASKFAIHPL